MKKEDALENHKDTFRISPIEVPSLRSIDCSSTRNTTDRTHLIILLGEVQWKKGRENVRSFIDLVCLGILGCLCFWSGLFKQFEERIHKSEPRKLRDETMTVIWSSEEVWICFSSNDSGMVRKHFSVCNQNLQEAQIFSTVGETLRGHLISKLDAKQDMKRRPADMVNIHWYNSHRRLDGEVISFPLVRNCCANQHSLWEIVSNRLNYQTDLNLKMLFAPSKTEELSVAGLPQSFQIDSSPCSFRTCEKPVTVHLTTHQ